MMCAVSELGLNIEDYEGQIEHGIMILPKSYETFLGMDIVDVLKLKEDILDFEITSNRPDCLSIEGLAREAAVSIGKPLKVKENKQIEDIKSVNEIQGLKVDIKAPDLCYRYILRAVKDVQIKPSPEWMQRRLRACGIRAINNIVDITNYVMLEMGQPMHAFDINSIEGKHIIVRETTDGEAISTLDEEQRKLDSTMLVIADAKKPVAVAGVMGGANSGIEEGTNIVIFESAVFNGANIRITAKKLGLRTEASSRYEKGLPQENALRVVNRAVELVEELGAGKAINEVIDVYPGKQIETKIKLEVDKINSLLGINISKEEMINILKSLEVKVDNDILTIPYFRQDLKEMADIAEEIIRIYGFDKLKSEILNGETTIGLKNKQQKLEENIKNLLVDLGFLEMYSFGFINPNDLEKCNISSDDNIYKQAIKLKNPLSEDYTIMRTTIMPSMMQSIANNSNQKNKEVRLFEIGKVFIDEKNSIKENKLPEESLVLGLAIYGSEVDFYYLKGIVQNILEAANIKRYEIEKEESSSNMHPGKTAKILIGKDVIAKFGEVHPLVQENYGINERVYFAQIDLDKLNRYSKVDKKYSPIIKYPAVQRDIAIIIDENIEVRKSRKNY